MAIEAEKRLAVGAPNGCGTMTRRAIHSLCQDKKAKGDDLFKQLNDLKERQLITPISMSGLIACGCWDGMALILSSRKSRRKTQMTK